MNIIEKSKHKKKNSKKRKRSLSNEKQKLSSIINPERWDGSSNWAQLVKTTGIQVGLKKKKHPDILDRFSTTMLSKPQNEPYKKKAKLKTSHTISSSVQAQSLPNHLTIEACDPCVINNKGLDLRFMQDQKTAKKGILKRPAMNPRPNLKDGAIVNRNPLKEHHKFDFKNDQSVDHVTGSFQDDSKIMTKVVAMDCEMVGTGPNGADSMLARVSIVNSKGDCLYDEFVKPKDHVTDYRTSVSGVRPKDLEKGKDLYEVQTAVSNILEGRTLVGHALHNDFKVLFVSHPASKIRDTSKYKPFRKLCNTPFPSLKKLTALALGSQIQTGEHNSVEDAQAAMQLYMMHRSEWEKLLRSKRKFKKKATKPEKATKARIF